MVARPVVLSSPGAVQVRVIVVEVGLPATRLATAAGATVVGGGQVRQHGPRGVVVEFGLVIDVGIEPVPGGLAIGQMCHMRSVPPAR